MSSRREKSVCLELGKFPNAQDVLDKIPEGVAPNKVHIRIGEGSRFFLVYYEYEPIQDTISRLVCKIKKASERFEKTQAYLNQFENNAKNGQMYFSALNSAVEREKKLIAMKKELQELINEL